MKNNMPVVFYPRRMNKTNESEQELLQISPNELKLVFHRLR